MTKLAKRLKGDSIIWTVLIFLSVFSLLAVYSSTGILSITKQDGNTEYYVLRQFSLLCVGFLLMWIIHKIKWNLALRKSAYILLIICIILLICTLVFGIEVNGAKRWLRIPGIGFQFQTSDLVKILFIIYLAYILPVAKKENFDFVRQLMKVYLPVWVVCGLILPMNFSTAAMLFIVSCIMMFISAMPLKSLLPFLGITVGVGMIVVIISLAAPESKIVPKRFTVWTNRLTSFVSDDKDKDENYQSDQAKIAVVRGSVFGTGPGNSKQRNYLPHPDCDFIYAIIIEEYGIIFGAIPIIILYLILLFRGFKVSRECEKPFSSYMVFGIVFIYVLQAFIHMGVCVGLGPVTGQNLPLVSTGGTALLTFCVAMGIVLSESRINDKRKAELLALEAAQQSENIQTEVETDSEDNFNPEIDDNNIEEELIFEEDELEKEAREEEENEEELDSEENDDE